MSGDVAAAQAHLGAVVLDVGEWLQERARRMAACNVLALAEVAVLAHNSYIPHIAVLQACHHIRHVSRPGRTEVDSIKF